MNSNTVNLLSVGTYNLDAVNLFAVEVLRGDFYNAMLYYTSSDVPEFSTRTVINSVLYIRGSGLERAIETFGLNVDAHELRESFYEFCTYYKRRYLPPHVERPS